MNSPNMQNLQKEKTIQMAPISIRYDQQIKMPFLQSQLKDINMQEKVQYNRVTSHIIWFIIVTIFSAAIPFVNLFLLFFQPFELAKGIDKTNLAVSNLGRVQNFQLFYLAMGLYGLISITFVLYSLFFSTHWQRFKLYFMVDTIFICMLATDIAYGALHIISFASVYSTDDEYNLTPTFIVFWQDYFVIAGYALTNFILAGILRILMVNICWKPWQVVVYKISITLTSLLYIALGLLYIFGADSLSNQISDFNTEVDPVIDACYSDPNYFDIIPYLQRQQTSLGAAATKINGFMLLYVFTNFAFFFEMVAKVTDFDGTSDLKTTYNLIQQEMQ